MSDEKLNSILDEVEEALSQSRETSCATQALVDTDFLSRSISLVNFSEPLICNLNDSVYEASLKLQEDSVGCVIIENDAGFIKGVFSERDFMTRVFNYELDIHETLVSEVMTADPTTVYPDDTIAHCLSLMSLGGFRHLPVVDSESVPVGILCMQDVVRGITERIMALCAN